MPCFLCRRKRPNDYKMDARSSIWITIAFTTGVLLTLGFKDFYPDLERRFLRGRRSHTEKVQDSDDEPQQDSIELRRYESAADASQRGKFANGLEGSIGNTPMFRLKVLSEATGCDILVKAEVFPSFT